MRRRWIVTALGKDRPGIVAGVTQVLYRLGCNLEDSAMTRLAGEFAIILIFSGPAQVAEASLQKAFDPLSRRLRLAVHLKSLSVGEAAQPAKARARSCISVYGADRPGIVFQVSEALAAMKVNITDVHTHRSVPTKGRKQTTLYLMLLEVERPPRLSMTTLEQKLQRIGKRLGVEVSVRSGEADVL